MKIELDLSEYELRALRLLLEFSDDDVSDRFFLTLIGVRRKVDIAVLRATLEAAR